MVARALFVAAMVLLGSLVAVLPASAESSSAITAEYPWPHNGCTIVPDNPAGVSFTYACNHHDGCYARHWASKDTCDLWFRNDMYKACDRYWYLPNWGTCSAAAGVYYAGVQKWGWKYYNSNGELSRINTPMRA